jgi:hypothetical protein
VLYEKYQYKMVLNKPKNATTPVIKRALATFMRSVSLANGKKTDKSEKTAKQM